MAVTHGHGNPNWTRDEVILALDLYFDCKDHIPNTADRRVKALSHLLRSFPHHRVAARKPSFRNADGVVFKLQNIRQVDTGRGLDNVSKMDRAVWTEFGSDPRKTRMIASLIRAGLEAAETSESDLRGEDEFVEGRLVTEIHIRRERDPKLRNMLLAQRRDAGALTCDVCGSAPVAREAVIREAAFEAHHIVPLSEGLERKTRLSDLALVCANCHRMLHRVIAQKRRWLSLHEAKREIHALPAR